MNFHKKILKFSKIIFPLIRGQFLLFPKLNLGLVRVYGRVTIRGLKKNITIGKNVIFLGDTTLICGWDALDDTIYIGNNVIIEHGSYINAHGGKIIIENHSFIGVNSIIQGKGDVHIGSYSMLGPNVQIYSSDHRIKISNRPFISLPEISSPIIIGKNVWIGANSIILKGTSIYSNSVIAAGSVVKTKNHSPELIYNPYGLASNKRDLL